MVSSIPARAVPSGPPPDFGTSDCRRLSVRTIAEASLLTEQFAAELVAADFTDKEVFGMRLAVEEAVVNGIKHGNGSDPSKQVRVQYHITPAEVMLTIEDEGPGFDPNTLADPLAEENLERCCGRGVFLMRFYMTSVQFNERGNMVTMYRKRAAVVSGQ